MGKGMDAGTVCTVNSNFCAQVHCMSEPPYEVAL